MFLLRVPNIRKIIPYPLKNPTPLELTYPEYEVLRLSEIEKKKQEEVARIMKTSRGTVWRLLESGREKLVRAVVEGRPLLITEKGSLERA